MSPLDALAAIRALCGHRQMVRTKAVLEILDAVESVQDPDLGEFEARVRGELARIAPPGSPPNIDEVKQRMTRFVTDELSKMGVPPFVAAIVATGIKITPKEPT